MPRLSDGLPLFIWEDVPVSVLLVGGIERPFADLSLATSAAIVAFLTLIFGGLLVYAAPNYAERTTQQIYDDPLKSFAIGLVAVTVTAFLVPALVAYEFIALAGVLLLFFSFFLVQIGFLAVGRLLTDRWELVLCIAVLVALFAGGVPWLGLVVGIVLGSLGFGAAILDYFDDGKLWTEEPDLTFGR